MKGTIKKNHIPASEFKLLVIGMPEITLVTVSGIEEELETVDLPDRTTASGGHTKPVEFTITQPMHHLVELAAMEAWFRESQDPVSPTYKKNATLVMTSIGGDVSKTYSLMGLYPSKQKLPDLDMANEGEMNVVEWTMKADDITPAP